MKKRALSLAILALTVWLGYLYWQRPLLWLNRDGEIGFALHRHYYRSWITSFEGGRVYFNYTDHRKLGLTNEWDRPKRILSVDL